MSYTIDVYRRQVRPARRFSEFGTYVTMFPQLIAGPIVRFSVLQDQIAARVYTSERFASGAFFVVIGIAKKLLIADTLALLSDPLFRQASPGLLSAWASMFLFAGQIYFDFSGYSDMAIGLGRMLGFEFPVNFDAPYKAASFSDFWRRWHITLSSWLRDYLYIPLGGNRHGAARTYANLMLTMLLGGLWHGASWSFMLWGFIHGSYLVVERVLGARVGFMRWPVRVRRVIVFVAVTVAWVPFKLEAIAQIKLWLSAMFGAAPLGSLGLAPLLGVLAFFALVWLPPSSMRWRVSFSPAQTMWALGLLSASILIGYGRLSSSPFFYFRF
jgi:alginate O-acetyltransferase complex protein AlgI